MPRPSPKDDPLHGRVILIVQRAWIIARTLADAFQVKGAQVVMTNTQSDVVNDPRLSAAVLDGGSAKLCGELKAKGIPFVLYTAREQTVGAPIIRKPAPATEVVARVEELLSE